MFNGKIMLFTSWCDVLADENKMRGNLFYFFFIFWFEEEKKAIGERGEKSMTIMMMMGCIHHECVKFNDD